MVLGSMDVLCGLKSCFLFFFFFTLPLLFFIPLFFCSFYFEKLVVSACLFFPSPRTSSLYPHPLDLRFSTSDPIYSSSFFSTSMWYGCFFFLVSYCSPSIAKAWFLQPSGFSALMLQSECTEQCLHGWVGKLKKKKEEGAVSRKRPGALLLNASVLAELQC